MKKYEDKWVEDFLIRSTWATNAIEGNKLTLNQTASILRTGTFTTLENTKIDIKDIKEAENGKEAFKAMMYALENNYPFTEGLILRFHDLVTKNLIKNSGRYKKLDNRIIGAAFDTVPALKVPENINNLISWYNNKIAENITLDDKIQLIVDFHIKFEMIHPFEDGNGRTGRLIMNYQLMKNNFFPVYFKERNVYLEQLELGSNVHDWKLVQASKNFIDLVKKLSETEKNYNKGFKEEREKGLTQEYYNDKEK